MSQRINPEEIVGNIYGNWKVLEYVSKDDKLYQYKCLNTDTGKTSIRNKYSLQKSAQNKNIKPVDLTGEIFGDLKIISKLDKRKGNQYWLARCLETGIEKEISYANLINGSGTTNVKKPLEDKVNDVIGQWKILEVLKSEGQVTKFRVLNLQTGEIKNRSLSSINHCFRPDDIDEWIENDGQLTLEELEHNETAFLSQWKSYFNAKADEYNVLVSGAIFSRYYLLWRAKYKIHVPNEYEINHINATRTDDRIDNLRLLTRRQNLLTRVKRKYPTTSKFKNVCWVPKRNRWRAYFAVDGQHVFNRYFREEDDAAVAYNNFILEDLETDYKFEHNLIGNNPKRLIPRLNYIVGYHYPSDIIYQLAN